MLKNTLKRRLKNLDSLNYFGYIDAAKGKLGITKEHAERLLPMHEYNSLMKEAKQRNKNVKQKRKAQKLARRKNR